MMGKQVIPLVLALAGAAWLHGMASLTATRATSTVRLAGGNARELLLPALRGYPTAAERDAVLDLLVARWVALEAALGPGASLDSLASARVRRAELPDAASSLTGLQARLDAAEAKGLPDAALLPAATADALVESLRERGVVVREPADFVRSVDRAAAGWAGGLLLLSAVLGRLAAAGWTGIWTAALGAVWLLNAASISLLAAWHGPLTGPLVAPRVGAMTFLGAVAAAALLLVHRAFPRRWIPRRWVESAWHGDGRTALAGAAALGSLLVAFGSEPQGSDAPVNLRIPGAGTVQPLGLATALAILGLAQFTGRYRHAMDAAWTRVAGGRLPDPALLFPFGVVLGMQIGAVAGLNDYGSASVIALGVALLAWVAAPGWRLAAALWSVVVAAPWVAWNLDWDPDGKVGKRMVMWLDPWGNGLGGLDQAVQGLWALVAGRWIGVGLGRAVGADVENGHSDLVLASLAEVWGVVGLAGVLGLYAILIVALLRLGGMAGGQVAERRFAAPAVAAWFAAHVVILGAGTTGLLPLEGIVAPFLSSSGSATVTGLILVGLALTATAAPPRAPARGDRLPLRLAATAGVFVLGGLAILARTAWLVADEGDRFVARPALTTTADREVRPRYNPRVERVWRGFERRVIQDRKGVTVAGPGPGGGRDYPFGAALAPLTGVVTDGTAPFPGTLEDRVDRDLTLFPAVDVG